MIFYKIKLKKRKINLKLIIESVINESMYLFLNFNLFYFWGISSLTDKNELLVKNPNVNSNVNTTCFFTFNKLNLVDVNSV